MTDAHGRTTRLYWDEGDGTWSESDTASWARYTVFQDCSWPPDVAPLWELLEPIVCPIVVDCPFRSA